MASRPHIALPRCGYRQNKGKDEPNCRFRIPKIVDDPTAREVTSDGQRETEKLVNRKSQIANDPMTRVPPQQSRLIGQKPPEKTITLAGCVV
jgi:hypothetical protein